MKDLARIILLFLWLFAIVAPSIITLCDFDNHITITNLNEEEQQESGKKNIGEEKFVKENILDFSLIALYQNSTSANFNDMESFDLLLEVLYPPPEKHC